jgi:hypothetical protein
MPVSVIMKASSQGKVGKKTVMSGYRHQNCALFSLLMSIACLLESMTMQNYGMRQPSQSSYWTVPYPSDEHDKIVQIINK